MSCSGFSIFGDNSCENFTPEQEAELTDVVEKTINLSAVQLPIPITTLVGELDVAKIKSYEHNAELQFDNTNLLLTADGNINMTAVAINLSGSVVADTIQCPDITTEALNFNNVVGTITNGSDININTPGGNLNVSSDALNLIGGGLNVSGSADGIFMGTTAIKTLKTTFTDPIELVNKNYVDTAIAPVLTVANAGGKIKVIFDNNIDYVTTVNPIWTDGIISIGWDAPGDVIQLMVNNAPSSGNISYYAAIGNLNSTIGTGSYGVQIAIGGSLTIRYVQRIWVTPSDPASGILNYKFSICNLPNGRLTVEKW